MLVFTGMACTDPLVLTKIECMLHSFFVTNKIKHFNSYLLSSCVALQEKFVL